MMQLGVGKGDITAFKKGVGMLGYGIYYNIMEEIETPLYARAFVFKNESTKVAYVNCEIAFITPSIKKGVIKKLVRQHPELDYTNTNLLLNAQHTHSGPGGYSHHGLYNMNSPGFVLEIYNIIVNGIVDAILKAEQHFEEVNLFKGKSEFAPELEVGFQRSLPAYLQNPEAKKVSERDRHLAIDREMTLLKFINKEGRINGAINWFGTHPTNMPNTSTKLCSDNKGYAATYLEEYLQKENANFIGAFAQGSCGDVSPKFTYNPSYSKQRGKWNGKYKDDDLKSTKYNGKLQFEKALEIIEKYSSQEIKSSALDSGLLYVNFANVQVNPKFTRGKENIVTSPACMGVAFMAGTVHDGPGMLAPLPFFANFLSNFVKALEFTKAAFMPKEWRLAMRQKYYAQGKKKIMIETGARKIMGTYNINGLILPAALDEVISNMKKFHRRGALDKNPWTPQILPLQIIKLGSLALCAIPFEITTIAAQRLKKSIESILLDNGYDEVLLCPYSNAYNGYITTYEEYQVQCYEGGHTVFGEWSLAALQTEFEKLAMEMLKPKEHRSLNNETTPLVFNDDELNKFEYFEGKYYLKTIKRKERIENIKKKRKARLEKKKNKIQDKIDKLN